MNKIKVCILVVLALLGGKSMAQTYYVLNQADEISLNTTSNSSAYTLSGPGETLTFEAMKNMATAVGTLTPQYSTDGSTWNDLAEITIGELEKNNYKPFSYALPEGVTMIRFHAFGSYHKYVKNVKVTMASYLKDASVSSLDFGSVLLGADSSLQFTIDYCNVGTLTFTSDNAAYTASPATLATGGLQGTQTVNITFAPTAMGAAPATLTIAGGAFSKSVTLNGTGLDYHQAPVISAYPVVSDTLTYGVSLKDIALLGGVAEQQGTWAWVDSLAMPNAGYNQQFAAVFVPTDEAYYTDTFQVTLNVRKASQLLFWEQDLSGLKLGDKLALNAYSGASLPVYYTSADSTKADILSDTLMAKAVVTEGVAITVHQDGNQNYEAAEGITLYAYIADTVIIKHDQEIIWAQEAYLDTVGNTVQLMAYSSIDASLPIIYSCEDSSVQIVGDTLLALAACEDVQLTAYQAGNDTLNQARAYAYITILQKQDTVSALPSIDYSMLFVSTSNGRLLIRANQLQNATLYAMDGRLVASKKEEQEILLEGLAPNNYILCVTIGGQKFSRTIIIN